MFHLPSWFSQESHHPWNPPCTNFCQPQLFQYSAHTFFLFISWMDICFTVTQLSTKSISLRHCTLSGVCEVCGLLVQGESQILACPLSPDNLHGHWLTALWLTAQYPYIYSISYECFPLSHSHNTRGPDQHATSDEPQVQQPFWRTAMTLLHMGMGWKKFGKVLLYTLQITKL
jgi:hypothetical protein